MSSAEMEMNMATAEVVDVEEEEEEEEEEEAEEEEEEEEEVSIAFQLQFEKPILSQVKIAEWNPEKDLLAMVTDDSKILLYRFNWQRLWTVSPGKCVTSLCWRPDGKVIAVGFEDGYIALYDVEHGKLLRNSKDHKASVICLCWEEDAQEDESNVPFIYEDRTLRFFPPPPRIPRMPGLSIGDAGLMDDFDNSFPELSYSSNRRFNILCSGDQNGSICFSVFGIFSIGKINIQSSPICIPFHGKKVSYYLMSASLYKVALSTNLCQLTILTFGDLDEISEDLNSPGEHEEKAEQKETCLYEGSKDGLHCLLLDTSIFHKRKNELFQVVQQASSIEDLIEVARGSLSVMHKQWCDAMSAFHQNFDPLYSLIDHHGLMSDPQVEFFSFLFGARTSPPLQQFLVQTLGESGVKRVAKVIHNAGKDIQSIVCEHLQPSAEIIAFRIGELIGLSKWSARYQGIGMDRERIDLAVEKAGMFLVQVERFVRVFATVLYEFQNFFNWLTKSVRHLVSESTADHYPQSNSELVIIFLQFHFDHDIVKQLLEVSGTSIEVDYDTILRLDDLGDLGGFSDHGFLGKSLGKQFEELETSFKDTFSILYTTISKKITSEYFMPLLPCSAWLPIPSSISYYMDAMVGASCATKSKHEFEDYISFKIPNDSLGMSNNIVIMRRLKNHSNGGTLKSSLQAVILSMPDGFQCIDLSLYKERQIVLLLNESITAQMENPGQSLMALLQTNDLPFMSSTSTGFWMLSELKDSIVELSSIDNKKIRSISHLVTKPLAVSAKRGVACVFSSRKRALVYILDEDED